MKANKIIPVIDCHDCSYSKLEYPSDEARAKAKALNESDFDNGFYYQMAKIDLMQWYCMENDDPPFQFVLRPVEKDEGIPEWCNLDDAPDGLEKYFFKPVIPPKDMRRP